MTPNSPQQKPLPQIPHHNTSNYIFASNAYPSQSQNIYPVNMQVHTYTSRRTPSNATQSTFASSTNSNLSFRKSSEDLQRSASSRSNGSARPNGYVTLMRKQKATVWCDRAQLEDPRTQAQQKAAKMRATREVISNPITHRTSTSGSGSLSSSNRVAAKIRIHGKASLVGYSPATSGNSVSGLPVRLSSTEVEGGDNNNNETESAHISNGLIHRRTGSGRSSTASSRKGLTYSRQSNASSTARKLATSNVLPNEGLSYGDGLYTTEESHASGIYQRSYFSIAGTGEDGSHSAGSGCSGERADSLPELNPADAARLASNSLHKSTILRKKSFKSPEELQRRGSVDDRTATMSTVRLFIANPDADSD
ncbi:hypothetical protein K3495_g10067 [Podosphaera aphanis]|nr:hypothetical protein K3495_g10067 [Podosphaera aphanis]